MSPADSSTMSPGTSCSIGTSSCSFAAPGTLRRTVAVISTIRCSASAALFERCSWMKPSEMLRPTMTAIVIAVMVGLSISLGFIQEHRSNKAAEALQRMVLITAAVRRQIPGAAQDHIEVPIEQLVPGDIVLLSAGDMIPADMRLISAKDLFINQSALTGEAMPLEKVAAAHVGTAETPFDLPNICFMGSAVVSGVGCGVVALTGGRTAFGQVASTIGEQRVLTSFDKGIIRITWVMIGLISI